MLILMSSLFVINNFVFSEEVLKSSEPVEIKEVYIANETTVRKSFITYEELVSLGCDDLCLTAPPWVYSSTYWTGTAEWTESIIGVDVTGGYGSAGFDSPTSGMGVRPVIKISKDYF